MEPDASTQNVEQPKDPASTEVLRSHTNSGTMSTRLAFGPSTVQQAKAWASSRCPSKKTTNTSHQSQEEKDKPKVSDVLYRICSNMNIKHNHAKWFDEDLTEIEMGNVSNIRIFVIWLLNLAVVQAFVFAVVTADFCISFYILAMEDKKNENQALHHVNAGILFILFVEILLRVIALGRKFFRSKLCLLEMAIVFTCFFFWILEAGVSASLGRTLRPVLQIGRILRRSVRVPIYIETIRKRIDAIMDNVVDKQLRLLFGHLVHLPADNITLHASQGHFRITKVHLLPKVWEEFHLPFTLRGGFVELIDVDMNVVLGDIRQVFSSQRGIMQVTIRNILVVIGSDQHSRNKPKQAYGEHWSYEEVLKRKSYMIEHIGGILDVFAVQAARSGFQKTLARHKAHAKHLRRLRRSQRRESRAREAAEAGDLETGASDDIVQRTATSRSGHSTTSGDHKSSKQGRSSTQSKSSARSRMSGKSSDADSSESSESDDEGQIRTPMSIGKDISRMVVDVHKQVKAGRNLAINSASLIKNRAERLFDAAHNPRQAVQELGGFLKSRVKSMGSNAVLGQVSAVNVLLENVSVQYEDTEPDRACASGGFKIGSMRARMERNTQDELGKAVDFRAKSSWDSSRGSERGASRKTHLEDMRIACQVDRLSSWWDVKSAGLDGWTLRDSELVSHLGHPAIASHMQHRQNVREHFQTAVFQVAENLEKENEPPSVSASGYFRNEHLSHLLPHNYLVVPVRISLHAKICGSELKSRGSPAELPKADPAPKLAEESASASSSRMGFSTLSRIQGPDLSRTSKASSKASQRSMSTSEGLEDTQVEAVPKIDVDMVVEDLTIRVDREQLASLLRLKLYYQSWCRNDEFLQWRPLHPPPVALKMGRRSTLDFMGSMQVGAQGSLRAFSSSSGGSHLSSHEHLCRDWWRYFTSRVLSIVLPYNDRQPSSVIQSFNMVRRSRLQVHLFCMYMKLFRSVNSIEEQKNYKARASKCIRQFLRGDIGGAEDKVGLDDASVDDPRQRLITFKTVMDTPWHKKKDKRFLEELQVALPAQVSFECRYSALRVVEHTKLEKRYEHILHPKGKSEYHGPEDRRDGELSSQDIAGTSADSHLVGHHGHHHHHHAHHHHHHAHHHAHLSSLQVRFTMQRFTWIVYEAPSRNQSSNVVNTVSSHDTTGGGRLKKMSSSLSIVPHAQSILHGIISMATRRNSRRSRLHVVHETSHKSLFWPSSPTRSSTSSNCNNIVHTSTTSSSLKTNSELERKPITRMRMSSILITVTHTDMEDVLEANVPTVCDAVGGEELSTGIRISVTAFDFKWCQAPPGASALRCLCSFRPRGTTPEDSIAFVIQIGKHKPPPEAPEETHADKAHPFDVVPDVWHICVKACPFKAVYNYPVISLVKNLMLLTPPPHRPPFEADPLGLKFRRWCLEVKQELDPIAHARTWKTRFHLMSGAHKRTGLMSSTFNFDLDLDVDTHLVCMRKFMLDSALNSHGEHKTKLVIIEHLELPCSMHTVKRAATNPGEFTWQVGAANVAGSREDSRQGVGKERPEWRGSNSSLFPPTNGEGPIREDSMEPAKNYQVQGVAEEGKVESPPWCCQDASSPVVSLLKQHFRGTCGYESGQHQQMHQISRGASMGMPVGLSPSRPVESMGIPAALKAQSAHAEEVAPQIKPSPEEGKTWPGPRGTFNASLSVVRLEDVDDLLKWGKRQLKQPAQSMSKLLEAIPTRDGDGDLTALSSTAIPDEGPVDTPL